jgi:bifunctional DNase/RNase
MFHRASVARLVVDPESKQPVVVLKLEEGDGIVPIWIGLLEAAAIASELRGDKYDRPMTHDLFKNFMGLLDIHVSRVDVCELKDSTYYAEIHFISKDNTFAMDARSSDAIAMALRFDAPIYVDESVISRSKETTDGAEVLDKSKDGEKWADYLKQLDPEDFGKYKV